MSGWILFQLLVDVALFALVIAYIFRDGRAARAQALAQTPPPPVEPVDTTQIEALMDELAKLIVRAEKVAAKLEQGAAQAVQAAPAAAPQRKVPAPAQSVEPADYDEEKYAAAAKLIKKGLSDQEIEKRVGLPANEISLIRNLTT